jgi:hypothetical protein
MDALTSSTKTQTSTFSQISIKSRRLQFGLTLLLYCGVLSSMYYVVINIVAPVYYPGYNMMTQTVSELSAIGAPSRQIWVLLCSVYSLLTMAFGLGLYVVTETNNRIRIVGVLMFFYGLSGFFWPPMHQREVIAAGNSTLTDTLHLVFAAITVLLMMLMIGLGAFGLGKKFLVYSLSSMMILVVFGTLTGMDSGNIRTGAPTPLIGLWERINIGVFILWVAVLSLAMIRLKNKPFKK